MPLQHQGTWHVTKRGTSPNPWYYVKSKRRLTGCAAKSFGCKGSSEVQPMPGHSSPERSGAAPLTLAPWRGLLSRGPLDSSPRDRHKEELQLPSRSESFEAAREFIKSTMPLPPPSWDRDPRPLAPRRAMVPSKGKTAVMARWPSPSHHHGLPGASNSPTLRGNRIAQGGAEAAQEGARELRRHTPFWCRGFPNGRCWPKGHSGPHGHSSRCKGPIWGGHSRSSRTSKPNHHMLSKVCHMALENCSHCTSTSGLDHSGA